MRFRNFSLQKPSMAFCNSVGRWKRQGFPRPTGIASRDASLPPRAHTVAAEQRRGFTTLEVIAAASVVTVALAAITPLFVRHARLVAESRRERIALEELANQAEQLAVVAGGDLAHHLATLAVSPAVTDHLPGARLQASRGVATPLGEPIVVSLTWNSPGRDAHPLALVTWLPIARPEQEEAP